MKIIFISIGSLLLIIFFVFFLNYYFFNSKQIKILKRMDFALDKDATVGHLSKAIKLQTISYQDNKGKNSSEFLKFHSYLEKTYPKLHSKVKKTVVADFSLLYKWKGSEDSLKPILLLAHLDVVPVEKSNEGQWEKPPFSGAIYKGFIWGRGTLDVKSGVIGIMEAVEYLVGQGFKPKRTIYLAFGHDEELGGTNGAGNIALKLKSEGIRFAYVLDEAGYIFEGFFPGLNRPAALVGIAEKGYLTLELSVETEGGHSSIPPRETSIGIIAKAVSRLEQNPFPGKIKGASRQMFQFLGPEMSFTNKFLLANLWLFCPVLEHILEAKPSSNAMLRTSIAPTIIEGGFKENVLPANAKCTVNLRINTGETIESAIAYVRDVIDDSRISIKTGKHNNPSSISDVESPSFKIIQKTISEVFPDTVVAPYLLFGATDSRHYAELSDQVYRFLPLRLSRDDLKRIHNVNERIAADNFQECVKFFIQLIQNSQGAGL